MVPGKTLQLGEIMDEEKSYDELVAERKTQERDLEQAISSWKQGLSEEELKSLEEESASVRKKQRVLQPIVLISLVILPIVAFYAVYGASPVDEKYLEEPADDESEEYEAYMNSSYSLAAACCLPIIGWLVIPFGTDPFSKKEGEVRLDFPLAGLDDDDLAIMANDRIEGTEMEAVMEGVASGEISECPNCDEWTLMKKSVGGRALKGLGRGFAKYARWEAGQMGTSSIVGSSGGMFDSATEDAAYRCSNCGYSESDREYYERNRM